MKLEDGKGSGRLAVVNSKHQLSTAATTCSQLCNVSFEDGEAYIWTSAYSASTGDEVIYIKNTSATLKLFIDKITVGSVNAGLFQLYEVSGTAGGTTITGKNINFTSGAVATASSYGDASVTGLTIGDRVHQIRTVATSSSVMSVDGALILGLNDAIAITYTGTGGLVDVAISGHFNDKPVVG